MLNDDELRERVQALLNIDELSGFHELAEPLLPEYRNSATIHRFVDLVRSEDATPIGALLACVVALVRENAELTGKVVEHETRKMPHEIVTDHGTYRYTGPTVKEAELEAELARVREVAGELLDAYEDSQRDLHSPMDADLIDAKLADYRERLGLTEDA